MVRLWLLAFALTGFAPDTPAAILSAQLEDAHTVTLQPGEIHVSEPIVIANGATLRGSLANNAPIGTTIVNHGPGPAILIPREARFVTIERLRVRCEGTCSAGIESHGFASNYAIRDVYVTGHTDGIKIGEGNFLIRLDNIFSDANTRHGFDIGVEAGYGQTGTNIALTNIFARWNGSYGVILRNLWGVDVRSSASDANTEGGWMFRNVAGTASAPTAESNPIGFSFVRSRMTVLSPTTDGCAVRYRREGGSVNIINSELNGME